MVSVRRANVRTVHRERPRREPGEAPSTWIDPSGPAGGRGDGPGHRGGQNPPRANKSGTAVVGAAREGERGFI